MSLVVINLRAILKCLWFAIVVVIRGITTLPSHCELAIFSITNFYIDIHVCM